MKKLNKLYLSLGLLFSITSAIYTYEEDSVSAEIRKELEEQAAIETQRIKNEIDQDLYDLFERFFNEDDTMPFSKFASKAIAILKIKKTMLHGQQQADCEELIKAFETNKHNSSPAVWGKILTAPNLLDLMSQETRDYLNGISNFVKMKSLINKLRNNNTKKN